MRLRSFLLLFFAFGKVLGQTSNPYGLPLITSMDAYRHSVAQDSDNQLVHISEFVPGVVLDIKYATKENVFYTKLYPRPIALIRLPVARALANAQKDFQAKGYGLKIYDGYRPYSITVQMYEILPDTVYMGLPWQGSKHNRGIALDLTLVNLKTGEELKMPTPFDALVYASHPEFMKLPPITIQNRELLKSVMKKHGFKVDPVEWWHFNYVDSKTYELLDIPIHLMEEEVNSSKLRSNFLFE